MLRRIFSLKVFIWTAIVFTALVLIFIAVENWRGSRAWENYRAAAEKRGVKLFLKDFIQPDIPDSENYAAVPLIRDLFAKTKDGENPPRPFGLPPGEKIPTAPNDVKGHRFDLTGWQDFFLKTGLLTEKTDSAGSDILRALGKYEPALQQLRDASSRPKCKFPTHWEDGPATGLPHLTDMRAPTVLFILRTHAHLHLGDSAAALGEFEQGTRLYEALASELSLIAGLTRISQLGMLETCVWDGLAGGQWGDAELAAIEKRFAALRIADDCRFAFATERGFGNAAGLDFVAHGLGKILDQMKPLEELGLASPPSRFERFVFGMGPRGWVHEMMVRYNKYFDWLLAHFDRPSGRDVGEFFPLVPPSKEWLESHPIPPGVSRVSELILEQSLPAFDTAQRHYLYSHTRAQETRLGCTLERFRRAKGGFPEKLDELVPAFIDAIPNDAFDGRPLRYRRNADGGYDLWSIGQDRKDDGGIMDPKKPGYDQNDWLWHMPGQAKVP